jgi:hypothetical protein
MFRHVGQLLFYLFITSFIVIFSEMFCIRSYFVKSYAYVYKIYINIIILQKYSPDYLSSRHALRNLTRAICEMCLG